MTSFARNDRSLLGRWWWTVDRWTLATIGLLIGIGAMMILAASPAVANRINLDSFSLARHHFVLIPVAVALMLGASLLSPRQIRRLALLGFVGSVGLTALTLVFGPEIKGATRWLDIGGFSLQPSEFVKPCFAVVAGWMFAAQHGRQRMPGNAISILLYMLVVGILLLQPDLGMTVLVSCTWFAQFFLAGLPIIWVLLLATAAAVAIVGAYFTFAHVAERIDGFLHPGSTDSYQIDRSLEAFANGGLWGRGPGEGTVKLVLPDAHADFVFAVAGEELGIIACILIVGLFLLVIGRGTTRLMQERNLFVMLAAAGLLVTFGLQAFVNMASSLHLMPTKGMTLPFISYGGSSLLASALGMGMLLALTRKRFGPGEDA
ncbi:MAG: FtsW/RodA/SpoVE family cell cycle protein [Dongiaceae bacterium]